MSISGDGAEIGRRRSRGESKVAMIGFLYCGELKLKFLFPFRHLKMLAKRVEEGMEGEDGMEDYLSEGEEDYLGDGAGGGPEM